MNFLALQEAARPDFVDLAAGPEALDQVGAWLIAFFTLAVFSFLYKDNPFYKIAEHVFVGAGTAFFALQYYQEGILEPLYEHIERAVNLPPGEVFQLGGTDIDPVWGIVWRSVAVLFGLMLLTRIFAPNSWMPRWPLAVMVGVYAALKMTGETQSKLVLLVANSFKSLHDPTKAEWASDWQRLEETQLYYSFANGVLIVGLLCALAHFLFTYKRGKVLGGVSRVGVIVLMVTFGSMFGFTVLGRYALLIERVDQLGGLTGGEYSLAPTDPAAVADGGVAWGSVLTSPPVLLAVLITLVLAVGFRGDKGEPSRA